MPLDTLTKLKLAQTDPQFVDWVFGSVEPEDLYLYQKLGNDLQKLEEMLIDPQIRGKLSERVGALLGRNIVVEKGGPRNADLNAVEVVKKILEGSLIPYESICQTFLMSGLLCGFSVMAVTGSEEKEYYYADETIDEVTEEVLESRKRKLKVVVPTLEFVPQRRFLFKYFEPDKPALTINDEPLKPEEIKLVNGYEMRLLTKRASLEGERVPADRFFVFTYGSTKGIPYGYGLGAQIRRFYEIRREVLKSGVLTADRLGSPPTHGKYPEGFDPEDPDNAEVVAAFNALVRAISPSAHAVTSAGFEINFLEPGKSGGHEILQWLYETAGLEIVRAIWGEGSYAEKETGSYAAEAAQAQNRNENIVDADCNGLDEQLQTQLWEWMRINNYPNALAPIVRRETYADRRKQEESEMKETRRETRINTDRTLILDLGLQPTEEYIKRTYGPEWSYPEEPAPEEMAVDETIEPVDESVEDVAGEELPADVDATAGTLDDLPTFAEDDLLPDREWNAIIADLTDEDVIAEAMEALADADRNA